MKHKKLWITLSVIFAIFVIAVVVFIVIGSNGQALFQENADNGLKLIRNSFSAEDYDVDAIGDCKDENITLPSSFKSKPVVGIRSDAFKDCTFIKSVTIPATIKNIYTSAFQGCTGLERFEVDEQNPSYSSLDGVLYNKEQTMIVLIPAALKGTVTIPDGVSDLNASTTATMFRDGFRVCDFLEKFTVSENHPTFSTLDGILYNKDSMSICQIPYGIKGDITIPGSVHNVDGFENRSGLTSVVFSEGVSRICAGAFENCTGLTSLSLPASLSEIESGALAGCDNIERISVAVDSPYFSSQNGLLIEKHNEEKTVLWISQKTSGAVTVPDGITAIGGSVFVDCHGVTSVSLPASLTSLGYAAFADCGPLTIRFGGSTDEWETVTKNSNWRDGTSVKEVVCKNGTLTGNDIG